MCEAFQEQWGGAEAGWLWAAWGSWLAMRPGPLPVQASDPHVSASPGALGECRHGQGGRAALGPFPTPVLRVGGGVCVFYVVCVVCVSVCVYGMCMWFVCVVCVCVRVCCVLCGLCVWCV